MSNQCSEMRVYDSGMRFPKPRRCVRNGTVERDGKWWCGTHDPEKVKACRSKSEDDYQARMTIYRQKLNDERVGAWLRENSTAVYLSTLDALKMTAKRKAEK